MGAGTNAGRVPADEKAQYADAVVKAGVIASVFWGIAGMLVGLIIALQLSFPNLFYFADLAWTNFGRLRPLHTSATATAAWTRDSFRGWPHRCWPGRLTWC